jgi:hypothetical protein
MRNSHLLWDSKKCQGSQDSTLLRWVQKINVRRYQIARDHKISSLRWEIVVPSLPHLAAMIERAPQTFEPPLPRGERQSKARSPNDGSSRRYHALRAATVTLAHGNYYPAPAPAGAQLLGTRLK